MSTYKSDDFEAYAELFTEESARFAKLMRILNGAIETETGLLTVRAKDLFSMAQDLMYSVDQVYAQKHQVEQPSLSRTFLIDDNDEYRASLRTMLQDEFTRFLGQSNE